MISFYPVAANEHVSLFNQYEEVDPARLQQLKNVIAKLLHLSTNPEVPSLLSFHYHQSIILLYFSLACDII